MVNLDSNYPKYHKVKTNRKGQFVSGSFLNIPLLLQSQGIGTFPRLKNAVDKGDNYSGSSAPQKNHKVMKVMKVMKESSMSNYNKARLKKLIFGETQEFQHHWSQGTKYQLQILNKYLNFHFKKPQKSFICPKVRGMKKIQVQKAQKPYNLLQEFQQTKNQNCQQQGYSHHQSTKSRSLTIFCKRFSNQKIIFVISISLSKMLQHTSQVE